MAKVRLPRLILLRIGCSFSIVYCVILLRSPTLWTQYVAEVRLDTNEAEEDEETTKDSAGVHPAAW